jgi:hypothetical protein
VEIGKSASETLALLTLVYGKYTMKKLSLNGMGDSRRGEKMSKEVGSPKYKRQMQMWTESMFGSFQN